MLITLGARHAASMHAGHAAKNPSKYPALEWSFHMAEEDVLLFPIFAKRFPNETQELIDDHAAFRDQIRRHGYITDLARMTKHSQLEDRLAKHFATSRVAIPRIG